MLHALLPLLLAASAATDFDSLLERGARLDRSGEFERAAAALERAVALKPADGAARLEWALSLARLHRYRKAREAAAPVAAPPDGARRIAFHRLKAAIASGLGDKAQAALEMNAALATAPDNNDLLVAAAVSELEAGRLDDALAHAQKARPAGGAAVEKLIGDVQEKRGEFVQAAQAYQAAVAMAPAVEQYRLLLALELVRHHTFQPAVAVLEQAAALFPKSARVRILLGVARYAMGDAELATRAMLDAAGIDGAFEPAFRYLAQFELRAPGAPNPLAVDALCRRSSALPRDADALAACSALRLRSARDGGDNDMQAAALDGLKRAALLSPRNAIARCELGRAYEALERWSDARPQLEQCSRLDPGVPQHHYRLSRIYQRLNLESLARQEADAYREHTRRLSEENARREDAVRAFQYVLR